MPTRVFRLSRETPVLEVGTPTLILERYSAERHQPNVPLDTISRYAQLGKINDAVEIGRRLYGKTRHGDGDRITDGDLITTLDSPLIVASSPQSQEPVSPEELRNFYRAYCQAERGE